MQSCIASGPTSTFCPFYSYLYIDEAYTRPCYTVAYTFEWPSVNGNYDVGLQFVWSPAFFLYVYMFP